MNVLIMFLIIIVADLIVFRSAMKGASNDPDWDNENKKPKE